MSLQMRNLSAFSRVPPGAKDAIFGIQEQFNKDIDKNKIDLTVGSYKDNQGKPYKFPSVRKAEEIVFKSDAKMNYLPILGDNKFVKASMKLLYGDHDDFLIENRLAAMQTLSGTGALRIAFDFLKKFLAKEKTHVYISKPTYANHIPVLNSAGFDIQKEYSYYLPNKNCLDFKNMYNDLDNAENGSIVLLQAVAHNPTGTDPTHKQWKELCDLFIEKHHVAVFDIAYQGFASGDLNQDAFAIRHFARSGVPTFACQSFAKNFGLYGHRTGCLSIVTKTPLERENVESQLKRLARTSYSNPPLYGAQLVKEVLYDKKLKTEWIGELQGVVERMNRMRSKLNEELAKNGSIVDWSHIRKQTGMFAFTGLADVQVEFLKQEWHVYLTNDGRLSVAALNDSNIEYVAEAIHAASR